MTEHERPKGVLRVGDRVRFEGRVHTVVGLSGTTVRLVDEHNTASMVMFAHLMASDGFELLDSTAPTPGLPPFGLLDTVPEVALCKARFFEKHLIEVETGLPPDAPKGTVPRPEYDPQWRTVNERLVAKAAELTAAGNEVSERTLFRLRTKWRDEGLWGLVDRRATRLSMAPGTGRVDERLVEGVLEVLTAQEDSSTGTRTRVIRQAEKLVAERHGEGTVPLPSRATYFRLLKSLSEGRHSFGAATTRSSLAGRPEAPFTPTLAARPGEVVQIDTTPLDVLAILDDGVTGRVELTIAVDVASRTICAAILRPAGTKAVDAALLPAQMLVPEPMRPGWSDALRMSASLVPHARLMSADARLEHAAARPVIVPDTIIVDRGKVFVSDTFVAACRSLGMSFQPARPAATPTDKGVVEQTFESINSMFCQHVAGYVGSDTTRRGRDVQAVWTISNSPISSTSGLSPGGRPARMTLCAVRSCRARPSRRTRSTPCWSPAPAICRSVSGVTTTSSCCPSSSGRSTTTASRSATAPTTAGSWAPTGASRPEWTPRATSGRSITTPTTCHMSGYATPGPEAGSPFPGPGWARSQRRSPISPGAMPEPCWPPRAPTTPTRTPSPSSSTTC